MRPRAIGNGPGGDGAEGCGNASSRVPGLYPLQWRFGYRHGSERLRKGAERNYPRKDPRHRIEHCSLVNPDLLARIKALGCVVTPFCSYIHYHGEKMRFYGHERVKWMFAQRSFIDYGINSTGAADYPCSPLPPLMGIQSCVTREDAMGQVWGPEQRISVEEALKLYTINGAYASFEEKTKGSIEVGKLADLVILRDDPTAVAVNTIKDIPVERTIVGGQTVYQRD